MVQKEKSESNIIKAIKRIIKDKIKPALVLHGGDIEYKGFKKGVVEVELTGACHNCAFAKQTLKSGVEEVLKHYIPEVEKVKAVKYEKADGKK